MLLILAVVHRCSCYKWKGDTNYPTIKDIFDNYNESIKTQIKTSRKNNFNPERNNATPITVRAVFFCHHESDFSLNFFAVVYVVISSSSLGLP